MDLSGRLETFADGFQEGWGDVGRVEARQAHQQQVERVPQLGPRQHHRRQGVPGDPEGRHGAQSHA